MCLCDLSVLLISTQKAVKVNNFKRLTLKKKGFTCYRNSRSHSHSGRRCFLQAKAQVFGGWGIFTLKGEGILPGFIVSKFWLLPEMVTVCVYSKETPVWCQWGPQGPQKPFEVVENHTQSQTEIYTDPNSVLIPVLTLNQFVSLWGLRKSLKGVVFVLSCWQLLVLINRVKTDTETQTYMYLHTVWSVCQKHVPDYICSNKCAAYWTTVIFF